MFGGKIMKKILAILLAMLVMLSFASCGTDTADDYADDDQNIGANNADDADVCHECGNKLSDDDEGWMSSVYDENGNMIDVYICDACWEAESNGDADVDAGATGDADVDAGATGDADAGDAEETTKGGYVGTPQYSNGGSDDGTLYECSVCGKKITEGEACIEASVVGTKIERTYYCPECFED